MKKMLLFSLVFLTLLIGCDKTKQVARKLDGTWNIYSYTQITSGGFEATFPVNGIITFSAQEDNSFHYEDNYSFDTDTGEVESQRKGAGLLLGEKSNHFNLILTQPSNSIVENGMIFLITKKDLKMGFYEDGIVHRFVLRRN